MASTAWWKPSRADGDVAYNWATDCSAVASVARTCTAPAKRAETEDADADADADAVAGAGTGTDGKVAAVERASEQDEGFGDSTQGERSGESGAEAGAVAGGEDCTGVSSETEVVVVVVDVVVVVWEAEEGPAITVHGGGVTATAAAEGVVTLSMASSDSSSMGVHRSCSLPGVTGDGGEGGGTAEKDVPHR